jgi:hypothetical protein
VRAWVRRFRGSAVRWPLCGRPGFAPGIDVRLLLIGYFEGIDAEQLERSPRHGRRTGPGQGFSLLGRYGCSVRRLQTFEVWRGSRPDRSSAPGLGGHMRTPHAYQSRRRSRHADARARLAVLRAEVADILEAFPELRADIASRPQRTITKFAPSATVRAHHRRRTGGPYTAH